MKEIGLKLVDIDRFIGYHDITTHNNSLLSPIAYIVQRSIKRLVKRLECVTANRIGCSIRD